MGEHMRGKISNFHVVVERANQFMNWKYRDTIEVEESKGYLLMYQVIYLFTPPSKNSPPTM